MGVVYIGKDPKISRVLAIKTLALSQEFEGDKLVEVKERFFREAKTAGRLNHPNIVTIYDVGEEQDLAYIAMDYVQGEDLSLHCEPDKLLSVEEVMEITAQVAEALNYAHDQQVVHRDIKPANIIYDRENGIAKVTDFGIACLTDTRNTKTGVVLGTPSYMSPQQLSGQRVDGRSDLFSLGVTFYELLTGELPFDGESLSTLVYNIANKKHRDVRKVRSGLPPCVAQIVNKALHKDLKKRFQTGSDMAEALRNCQEKM
jgi:serine/threonine-protein kinase